MFGAIGILALLAYSVIPIAILWYVIFTATRAGIRAAMKESGTKF
jgi:hypothetical protein